MTSSEKISGSCLCGVVTFEIKNEFAHFQLCHCTQCQKMSGSAHASNLFTKPDYITWLSGEDGVHRYDVKGRKFSNAFCRECGSRVPFVSLSGRMLAVPAGSLDGEPNKSPQANIFWPERAAWYDEALQTPHFDRYIEK